MPEPATNPEELLASAVAGCYAITFGLVAAHRKLPVVRVDVDGAREVEEDGPRSPTAPSRCGRG